MDGTGQQYVKQSNPGLETQLLHVFCHRWQLDPKDKHIHKCMHDHIYIYIQNVFITVGLLEGPRGT
jgi:hypothetical protein